MRPLTEDPWGLSKYWTPHVRLGKRRGGGAGGYDLLEVGDLEPLAERSFVGEPVQHRGHVPTEALALPDTAQAGAGVRVESRFAAGDVEVADRVGENRDIGCGEVDERLVP